MLSAFPLFYRDCNANITNLIAIWSRRCFPAEILDNNICIFRRHTECFTEGTNLNSIVRHCFDLPRNYIVQKKEYCVKFKVQNKSNKYKENRKIWQKNTENNDDKLNGGVQIWDYYKS